MADRIVLVPGNASVLHDPTTKVLNTYANGFVLISTGAAAEEDPAKSGEVPVTTGVRIDGVGEDQLDQARKLLNGGANAPAALAVPAPEAVPAPLADDVPLAYVEFVGPVDGAWLTRLSALGVTPLRYHPENTYLCRGTRDAFRAAAKESFVLHVTPLTDVMKSKVPRLAEGGSDVRIVVQGTSAEAPALLRQLAAVPGVEVLTDQTVEAVDFYLRIRARLRDDAAQQLLLKSPRVLAVERFVTATPEDEVADLILAGQYDAAGRPSGSYLNWLEDQGLNGTGVTIGIVDGGVDKSHPAFAGRLVDLLGGEKEWHGTFVAGHAAGAYLTEKDGHNFIYGVGMAPAANLLSQDRNGVASDLCRQTVGTAGPSGAPGSVQNNSWGKGLQNPMDYQSDEATYDRMVRQADPQSSRPTPLTICFSSGNDGQAGLTRPKAAKNIIVTGNSKNFRPDVGADQSDNIRDVYGGPNASSWGNCGDGRIRPHVMAPGEWTSSANYDSHPGEREYISPELTWGGGSSGASPKTAGACALLIQWWRLHNAGADPSPAMLRALIVNGAEPLDTGGPVPNNRQGWGRLNLQNVLAQDVGHTCVDQTVLLAQPGDQKAWDVQVSDPSRPVKVTLAWTDPPGPIGSGSSPSVSPIVNRLALRVQAGGHTYRGGSDQFQNGWSAPADQPPANEGFDNLQNVFLPPGTASGTFRVTVAAINVTTDCLTGSPTPPQQDFALVISNGRLDPGSTPANVAVVVDQSAGAPAKPAAPTDFWSTSSGNSDSQLLNADWWATANPAPAPQPAPSPSPSTGPASTVDDWWAQGDVQFAGAETQRASGPAPLTRDPQFAAGLQAGLDLLGGGEGHRVRVPVGPASESGGGPGAGGPAATDLSQALADLMANWDSLGAAPAGDPRPRRRVVVLVVGAGTRVTRQDLDAMRRLSFLGELYLVSDNPPVLAFLAQRIGRTTGIHFRLARDAAGVPGLLADTLAEAGGMQQVGVTLAPRPAAPEGRVIRGQFGVVAADRLLSIRIGYPTASGLKEIRLERPGQAAVVLDPANPGAGTRCRQRPGLLQVDIDAPADGRGWAGPWAVQVTQPPDAPADATIAVWAQGGPTLLLRKEFPEANQAGGQDQMLVMLRGEAGVAYNKAVIPPPAVIASAPVSGEEPRDVLMEAQRSRLDPNNAAPEDARNGPAPAPQPPPTATALARVLKVPSAPSGAMVLDIAVQVPLARDAQNQYFARSFRTNSILLQPRARWRQGLPAAAPVLAISAQVVAVRYQGGKVVGLRLGQGDRRRDITVSAPQLADELTRIPPETLKGSSWAFGVAGEELLWALRGLDGAVVVPASPLPATASPSSVAPATRAPAAGAGNGRSPSGPAPTPALTGSMG